MSAQTRKIVYDFRGALKPPVVASRLGIWCSKIGGGGGGSPTIQSQSGGPLELTLEATSEVQNLCLYMGDILPFDIDDIVRVEFVAKLSASLAAAVSGHFGIGSARNDTLASVAQFAGFRFAGSNAVVLDSRDGTNTQSGVASGFSLAATYRRFAIDLSVGNLTQSPPSLSKGGTADLRYFMSNDKGALQRVGQGSAFNMSAYTGNLQLLAQIQKTSGTAVGTLSILEASIEYRLPV